MEIIVWDKKYETGNFEIDSEHKVFLRLIQKVNEAIENKREEKRIARLMEELQKYAEFHFCSEENIMMEADFPGLESHVQEHQKLSFDLRSLLFADQLSTESLNELVGFLVNWFENHTFKEDMKVALFLKEKQKK
jgi:hemerythrin